MHAKDVTRCLQKVRRRMGAGNIVLGQMARQQKLGLEDNLNDLVCTEGDDLAIALIYGDVGHSRCMTLQRCRLKLASGADCPLLLLQASAEGQLLNLLLVIDNCSTSTVSLQGNQHINTVHICTVAVLDPKQYLFSSMFAHGSLFARYERSKLHASLVSSGTILCSAAAACMRCRVF